MLLRSLVLVTGLSLALACAAGCAASAAGEGEGEAGSSEIALTQGSLRERTALERLHVLGSAEGAVQVAYAPVALESYDGTSPDVRFEAVHFDASEAASEVLVAGDFPSSATVVVTDEEFNVLTAARSRASASGLQEARLRVPAGATGRLVLVRDAAWVKPMVFEVRVGR